MQGHAGLRGFKGRAMLKYFPKDTLTQWVVGSVAVAGAASVAYVLIFPSDTPEPALPVPNVMQGEPAGVALPQDEPAPDIQIAMVAPTAIQPPSFDLVRMTDLGDVLIAGKAPARSSVSALIDEDPVAQAVSTPAGEFVLMFEVAPSPTPRVLELEVRLPNGDRLRSVDTLMLAPRSATLASGGTGDPGEHHVQTARVVAVEPLFPDSAAPPRPPVISEPSVVGTARPSDALPDTPAEPQAEGLPTQQTAHAEQPEAEGSDLPDPRAPVAVLLRADGAVQVLGEAASLSNPASGRNVSIDTVTYDTGGEVALSGRTRQGAADVQIYLDNQPILRARATPDGNWQAQLDGIERGVYRLRVDELDDAAQVTSRAEIPFERATPEIAREAGGMQALIVQPGNTLWAMSQQQFGDGARYMRIFDANRDQIRNPDLIYPGQVFILPQDTDTAGRD